MDSAQLVATLISSLGIPGVLAWFLWYDTTTRQPEIRRHYETIVDKVLAQNEQSLKEILAEHKAESVRMTAEIHGMIEHCKTRNSP